MYLENETRVTVSGGLDSLGSGNGTGAHQRRSTAQHPDGRELATRSAPSPSPAGGRRKSSSERRVEKPSSWRKGQHGTFRIRPPSPLPSCHLCGTSRGWPGRGHAGAEYDKGTSGKLLSIPASGRMSPHRHLCHITAITTPGRGLQTFSNIKSSLEIF